MFLLVCNSGSNHNYIGLTITNQQIENKLTYHDCGSHGIGAIDISYMNYTNIEKIINKNNCKFMVCFSSKWNNEIFNLLKKNKVKIIQILIEHNQECMLINWQEKLRINPQNNEDKKLSTEWEKQQKNIWENYTKFPIERAVMEWTYKLYDKQFIDVRKIIDVDAFFSFGSLYDSYDSAYTEFKKFNIEYSKNKHDDWKLSQKIIFDSWNFIKNNLDTPKNLEFDYQRGIAIALKGIKENIDLQNCWSKYESLLN
jgi:hypothetical protein